MADPQDILCLELEPRPMALESEAVVVVSNFPLDATIARLQKQGILDELSYLLRSLQPCDSPLDDDWDFMLQSVHAPSKKDSEDSDDASGINLESALGCADIQHPIGINHRPRPSSSESTPHLQSDKDSLSLGFEDGVGKARHRCHNDRQWFEFYDALVKYLQAHGDTLVPYKYPPNRKLGQWVKRQRFQHKLFRDGKHTTLTASRRKALDDIGFIWRSHDEAWTERFAELQEFSREHGHCDVPQSSDNPQLSLWVKTQRRHYVARQRGKSSPITVERIRRLEAIGFLWTAPGRREKTNDARRSFANK